MTFHVALASNVAAVMISDSQASTNASESHGFQKQMAGANYLAGASGVGPVCLALLAELSTGAAANKGMPPKAADVERVTLAFYQNEIHPVAAPQTSALFVLPSGSGYAVRKFEPAIFRRFSREEADGTIGSGAEFARRATARNDELGIVEPRTELVDLFIAAESQACAANESLTVDDQLLVGLLHGGKSYLLGHESLKVSNAPDPVKANWITASSHYVQVRAIASAMRSELREAHRAFSDIRKGGGLGAALVQTIQPLVNGVAKNRSQLAKALNDYCRWYDGLLGR